MGKHQCPMCGHITPCEENQLAVDTVIAIQIAANKFLHKDDWIVIDGVRADSYHEGNGG